MYTLIMHLKYNICVFEIMVSHVCLQTKEKVNVCCLFIKEKMQYTHKKYIQHVFTTVKYKSDILGVHLVVCVTFEKKHIHFSLIFDCSVAQGFKPRGKSGEKCLWGGGEVFASLTRIKRRRRSITYLSLKKLEYFMRQALLFRANFHTGAKHISIDISVYKHKYTKNKINNHKSQHAHINGGASGKSIDSARQLKKYRLVFVVTMYTVVVLFFLHTEKDVHN